MTRTERAVLGPLGFVVLSLIWGTQFLVIKIGEVTLPPFLTVSLRFAVLALAAQIAVRRSSSETPAGLFLPRVAFGLAQALSFGALYWSQRRLPSGVAGILSSTTPLFVALIAHRFVVGERLRAPVALATLAGFVGVSLIVVGSHPVETPEQTVAVGVIVVGELAAATNKVVAKRLTGRVPVAVLLRDMGVVVSLTTGTASLLLETHLPMRFTFQSVIAFGYLGLVASFGASALYLSMLRRYALTSMSYLQFTSALVAASAGALVAGERIGAFAAAGGVAILAGLAVVAADTARRSSSSNNGGVVGE